MTPLPELTTKYQILSRRVESLPAELKAWIDWAANGRTLEKNFSQIEVLAHFMNQLCKSNTDGFKVLDPADNTDVFLINAHRLAKNMLKAHAIWNFFRDRLELRFVPQFQQPLLMADLVSHDCYTTVMDRVEALRIYPQKGFREYPLTGLCAEFSPGIRLREQRPPALQNPSLPISVIELPWDHLANPWELLVIAHEVGHDVDKALGNLTDAIQCAITTQLETARAPAEHITQWQEWTCEILADLFGVLLTGPAFVRALIGLLTLPSSIVRHFDSTDPHPPHYLRVFINTMLVRQLGLPQSADAIEASWMALYGEPSDDFRSYLQEIEPVTWAILNAPLANLQDFKGRQYSLTDLIIFKPNDHLLVQETATKLASGLTPGKLSIRHVVSASQLAFEQMVAAGDAANLEMLARRTQQTIIDLSPPGQLLAGLASRRTREHLYDLARACLERPLEDFGIPWPCTEGER